MFHAPSALAQDDIAALQECLRLPELPYVDFSLEADQRAALDNWPLLRELYLRPAEDGSL